MLTDTQPKEEYFMLEFGFDGEVVIEPFFSSKPEEMKHPEIHGMRWIEVQSTLHNHYKNISKSYSHIADDWATKTCNEYFARPKTNQDELWEQSEEW